MTPRQLGAYVELAYHRGIADRAADLSVTALGAQGSGDGINAQLKEWEAES
jgi:hypothetical protein